MDLPMWSYALTLHCPFEITTLRIICEANAVHFSAEVVQHHFLLKVSLEAGAYLLFHRVRLIEDDIVGSHLASHVSLEPEPLATALITPKQSQNTINCWILSWIVHPEHSPHTFHTCLHIWFYTSYRDISPLYSYQQLRPKHHLSSKRLPYLGKSLH
ncbi:hypothetical protein DL93DRAFT_127782 [Clavulina sp. PMI_390]|nr:hypothetical protein DL93DRAFT_127782 [Clavulina sp. PMI_390]